MEELIDNLCEKLHCTQLADDLEKLHYVRDMLLRVQQQELFRQVLGPDDYVDEMDDVYEERVLKKGQAEVTEAEHTEEEAVEDEEVCVHYPLETLEELPEDAWHGYFKGYQIISDIDEFSLNPNKRCVELTRNDCDETLDAYLRAGVRCFLIDLFTGTDSDNQTLIVRLRQSELNLSKEIGFPVTSTLVARLSPRLQYTGLMDPPEAQILLSRGEELTLTTDRSVSYRGSRRRIYVNARFLLEDVKECDFILIGPDIQLHVRKKKENSLRCMVMDGGILKSRLPVLFPSRCNKFRLSLEELEDITFAKEVGINAIVSYIAGSQEYFNNLAECLRLLHSDKMRLFARVVLNEIKGCDNKDWITDCFDGFVIELSSSENKSEVNNLHLCPAAEAFIKRAYDQMKPIIFDPLPIAEKRLIIEPEYFIPIFYYPDKYLFKCDRARSAFYFYFLQGAMMRSLPQQQLSQQPYCDQSLTGSDSLARACVSAAFEMNATAIFVCSLTGRMAIKISHFRPDVPIILITRMRSAEKFISLYHNIIMLYYRGKAEDSHRRSIYKHLLFGLLYAKARRMIKHNDNVIFVYREEPGTLFSNKYVAYKFHERYFARHLSKTLFPMHSGITYRPPLRSISNV